MLLALLPGRRGGGRVSPGSHCDLGVLVRGQAREPHGRCLRHAGGGVHALRWGVCVWCVRCMMQMYGMDMVCDVLYIVYGDWYCIW